MFPAKLVRVLLSACGVAVACATSAVGAASLTLLHNNDGESKLLGSGGFGGVAYFATVLASSMATRTCSTTSSAIWITRCRAPPSRQVVNLAAWPINADEVPVFDYNDGLRDAPGEAAFEAEPTRNPLYEANPFRTSDHDPVIVDLDLVAPLVGDVDRDGAVDKDDLLPVMAARNRPASGPNDPRDLNGDGRIDALDARLLVLRCSNPGCGN